MRTASRETATAAAPSSSVDAWSRPWVSSSQETASPWSTAIANPPSASRNSVPCHRAERRRAELRAGRDAAAGVRCTRRPPTATASRCAGPCRRSSAGRPWPGRYEPADTNQRFGSTAQTTVQSTALAALAKNARFSSVPVQAAAASDPPDALGASVASVGDSVAGGALVGASRRRFARRGLARGGPTGCRRRRRRRTGRATVRRRSGSRRVRGPRRPRARPPGRWSGRNGPGAWPAGYR